MTSQSLVIVAVSAMVAFLVAMVVLFVTSAPPVMDYGTKEQALVYVQNVIESKTQGQVVDWSQLDSKDFREHTADRSTHFGGTIVFVATEVTGESRVYTVLIRCQKRGGYWRLDQYRVLDEQPHQQQTSRRQ